MKNGQLVVCFKDTYVDEIVYEMYQEGMTELNREAKASLLHILTCDTHFAKITRPLSVALTMTAALCGCLLCSIYLH